MNWADRLLQNWRIAKARPWLVKGARVLDIGCADGALFRRVKGLGPSVGIDPDVPSRTQVGTATLLKGAFPQALEDSAPFDAITLLAVLEHIPPADQPRLAADCARFLKPGGWLLMTVPAPAVDSITHVLRTLRIIHGMSLEEHTGLAPHSAVEVFASAGLELVKRKKFQLGLNNLFVFRKEGRPDVRRDRS